MSMDKNELSCSYCGKIFKQQKRFDNHCCKAMQRVQNRQKKSVRLALSLFNTFKQTQLYSLKTVGFDQFEKNLNYNAFVKFGEYCYTTKIFAPEEYLKWLLDNQIRINQWCEDIYYDRFLINHLQKESVNLALERAIIFAHNWGEQKNISSHNILRHMSEYDFIKAILDGQLSPWILYLTTSGQLRLNNLSNTTLEQLWLYIDTDIWSNIFKNHYNDVEFVKKIMKQAKW